MDNKTITSTLDIVNWFCRKAAAVGTTLDENKIQHLLFLAQIHYALKSGHFLMPSLFVCSRSGFYEPTVRVLMRFGLPLLPEPCFKTEINTFLELIWQKYAGQSETELNRFILSLDCWKQSYRPEAEIIVDPMCLAASFADSIKQTGSRQTSDTPKIRLSQNGPVKVSTLHPRKLSDAKP